RAIVRRIARVGKLHNQMKLDRPAFQTRPEFCGEKIGRFRSCLLVSQVMLTGERKYLVTPCLFHAILVDENERVVGKETFGAEACGYCPGFLHEFRRKRMCAEKHLD